MSATNSRRTCPRCGGGLQRTHRRFYERLIAFVIPILRFRCAACGWSGLRRSHRQHS